MSATGHSVQVVKVLKGHAYQLDEKALQAILLRDDVKDLPVVAVSVAGAFRGGKSFLLNFFLRYLYATPSQRADDSWIGQPGQSLTGFSWRGGSERNTTGILMWSDPVICSLPSGERVAVLVFDTQGTFDSNSTIRDCSTIFALSTLLSSVQVYNLSINIKEDDLQHLQLFTEYGKLIKTSTGEAFQALHFLVRDWQYPFEYEFGAEGGAEFLQKKLEIRPEQPKDLRELRQHIHSSFQTVSCFLMPHPGFRVLNPKFTGSVTEIEEDFKLLAAKFIKSIFEPSKLTPKIMGGQKVKARDLFSYFKTYMKIFNSDKIPSPASFMKATAEAGLLAAMTEAQDLYEARMQSVCGEGKPSLPAQEMKELHNLQVATAVALFTNKKKLGSKEDAAPYLQKLNKTLESRLGQYSELNIAKTQKAMIDAKEVYEQFIQNVSKDQLCLHPRDLDEIHNAACAAAIKLYDTRRKKLTKETDAERNAFIKSFEKHLNMLKLTNQQNNNALITEMRLEYWTQMEQVCSSKPPLAESDFQKKHEEALEKALEGFHGRRNHPNTYNEDEYESNLITIISSQFNQLKLINKSNNQEAFKASLATYTDYLASAWDHDLCLHPDDLVSEHETAKHKAIAAFRPNRSTSADFNEADYDEKLLKEILLSRFKEMRENNELNNKAAVQTAFNHYSSKMEVCTPSWSWLLVVPIVVTLFKKSGVDKEARKSAISVFMSKRHSGPYHSSDVYLEDLKTKMEEAYKRY